MFTNKENDSLHSELDTDLKIVKNYMCKLANKILYSKGAEVWNINREIGDKYQKKQFKNDKELAKYFRNMSKLESLFETCEYQKAFENMLTLQTGDCWDQSMYLASLLMQSNLNDKYNFFLCRAMFGKFDDSNSHSFLILINRNYNILFAKMRCYEIEPEKLISLIKDKQSFIADPWRGLIFTDITENKHPCDYNDKMKNFQKIELLLTNLEKDNVFIKEINQLNLEFSKFRI